MKTQTEPCPVCYTAWVEKECDSLAELLEEPDWWNPTCPICNEGWIEVVIGGGC